MDTLHLQHVVLNKFNLICENSLRVKRFVYILVIKTHEGINEQNLFVKKNQCIFVQGVSR